MSLEKRDIAAFAGAMALTACGFINRTINRVDETLSNLGNPKKPPTAEVAPADAGPNLDAQVAKPPDAPKTIAEQLSDTHANIDKIREEIFGFQKGEKPWIQQYCFAKNDAGKRNTNKDPKIKKCEKPQANGDIFDPKVQEAITDEKQCADTILLETGDGKYALVTANVELIELTKVRDCCAKTDAMVTTVRSDKAFSREVNIPQTSRYERVGAEAKELERQIEEIRRILEVKTDKDFVAAIEANVCTGTTNNDKAKVLQNIIDVLKEDYKKAAARRLEDCHKNRIGGLQTSTIELGATEDEVVAILKSNISADKKENKMELPLVVKELNTVGICLRYASNGTDFPRQIGIARNTKDIYKKNCMSAMNQALPVISPNDAGANP